MSNTNEKKYKNRYIIYTLGPTGSGKTKLQDYALEEVKKMENEVKNNEGMKQATLPKSLRQISSSKNLVPKFDPLRFANGFGKAFKISGSLPARLPRFVEGLKGSASQIGRAHV